MSDTMDESRAELALKIIKAARLAVIRKYSYLEKPLYFLELKPDAEVNFMGANYRTLYFNPEQIIEAYSKKRSKIEDALVHSVLHCLMRHLSIAADDRELFDAAADTAINAMIENAGEQFNTPNKDLAMSCGGISAIKIYNKARLETAFAKKLTALASKKKNDDHRVWTKSKDEKGAGAQGSSLSDGKSGQTKGAASGDNGADEWEALFGAVSSSASKKYGLGTGNLFGNMEKPDRFSRFSYIEYLKRFAENEVTEEDPETLDIMLYTAGMDMYGDMPIVEWNELRERCDPTDIIIAIDMSGSCSSEISSNFLRQVYTLFSEMGIRSIVNIHVVFFDASILGSEIIRSRNDAETFIEKYQMRGYGGTDFRCVFDYADNFEEVSNGRRLKALFFFSDACGFFPEEEKSYTTTFFVPESSYYPYMNVPEWIELVKYNDEVV